MLGFVILHHLFFLKKLDLCPSIDNKIYLDKEHNLENKPDLDLPFVIDKN